MVLETALRGVLLNVVSKVFPNAAPEGTPAPFIVYISEQGTGYKTLTGFLPSRTIHIELHIVCKDYDSLRTNSANVVQQLQTFEHTAGVMELTFEQSQELYDQDLKLHVGVLQFTVDVN